jgi:hypothetical protein
MYEHDFVQHYNSCYEIINTQVDKALHEFNCFYSIRYAYSLKVEKYIINYQIEDGINFCNQILNKIIQYKLEWPVLAVSIQLKLIQLYFVKRDYTSALNILNDTYYLVKVSDKNNIHYRFKVFKIITYFHLKKYEQANSEIESINSFNRWYSVLIELFYICCMMNCLVFENKSHRFYFYLNNLKILTQDKKGINSQVIVLVYIYELKSNKYSSTYDSARNLQQYAYRHLKGKEHVRARGMIKNLIAIPKYNFDLLKLDELPKTFGTEDVDSSPNLTFKEIIPYENLWEITLEILENNLPDFQRERLQRARAKRDARSGAPQA